MEHYTEEARSYDDNFKLGLVPAFTGMDLACDEAMMQLVGHKLSKLVISMDGGNMALHYFSKEDCHQIAELMLKKLIDDPEFIEKIQAQFLALDTPFLNFCDTHFTEKVQVLSDEGLADLFQKYISLYKEIRGKRNIYYHFLGQRLEEYLKELLSKYASGNIQAHFTTLTTTREPTWAEEERTHFLELAALLQNGISKEHPEFKQKLAEHEKLFQAFMFDYHGPLILDKKHFLAKIEDYLAEKKDAHRELQERKEKKQSLLQKQESLAAELGLSPTEKKYFRVMQLLILWKEHKKKIHSRSHVPFQTIFMLEVCKRLDLDFKYARFLDEDELVEALHTQKVNLSLLQQRAEHFTIIHTPEGKEILSGDAAFQYNLQLKPVHEFQGELTGSAASMGKYQGKAVIILNENDLARIQPGDVLVTTMTKPQYIIAMQKAGAFVTDSGGITCHAAILAREMEKPCVVGTNMATKVLKDGDLIEIDADTGIVRIISPAPQLPPKPLYISE